MTPTSMTRSRANAVLCAATFVAFLGVGVGCSTSSDNVPPGTTTSFYGVYTEESGAPGTIQLSGISAPAAVAGASGAALGSAGDIIPLAGQLTIAGQAPISISGSYDTGSGAINFTSDDQSYTFTGTVNGTVAAGTSKGPNGAGTFVLILGGTPATTAAYCGTAVCDPVGCTTTGSFNVAVSGSAAILTVNVNGAVGFGAGTATASTVDFHVVEGTADLTIHGDISGTDIGGTWSDANSGESGTWSGSTAQCTAAGFSRQALR